MEIKITIELSDKTIELIKSHFAQTDTPNKVYALLADSEKLEAIKAEVISYTRKGKGGDIKTILKLFSVSRVSELTQEDYDDFYNILMRYKKVDSL